MAITIRRVGDRYSAEVTPPHGGGVPWGTPDPMPARQLTRALLDRGCHQTDVGDAFYEADPAWVDRLPAEEGP